MTSDSLLEHLDNCTAVSRQTIRAEHITYHSNRSHRPPGGRRIYYRALPDARVWRGLPRCRQNLQAAGYSAQQGTSVLPDGFPLLRHRHTQPRSIHV